MKLNERMRYPHPVLSEYSADYVLSEFLCSFEQNLTPKNEVKIAAELQLRNAALQDLIETRKAAAGYFVVCRRTYYNYLQEVPIGKSEKFFDASRLYGTILIRPVIWTLAVIKDFHSPIFDREFGEKISIARGSVIALGPEFRFSMDRKKYKPFDSIFELGQDSTVTANTVAVDPDQDRITILAEPKTFASIVAMRGPQAGRSILLNAVYLPAIMDVISRLQTGDRGLESKKWYRIFRAKCDDLAIDPKDPNRSPLELAQKLLKEPLKKAIAVAESA
jgi:hypothetical protein